MQTKPEQIIKNLFPDIPHRDRKKMTTAILSASVKSGKTFEEIANLYKKDHDKGREEALPSLLKHCLITALLVESNDSLIDTHFEGYYNKVIGSTGKSFMNAQNKLYLKEFNDLATSQQSNVNDLLKFKEIALDALSNSFDEDFEELAEVLDIWSKNKTQRKRILGIARKI